MMRTTIRIILLGVLTVFVVVVFVPALMQWMGGDSSNTGMSPTTSPESTSRSETQPELRHDPSRTIYDGICDSPGGAVTAHMQIEIFSEGLDGVIKGRITVDKPLKLNEKFKGSATNGVLKFTTDGPDGTMLTWRCSFPGDLIKGSYDITRRNDILPSRAGGNFSALLLGSETYAQIVEQQRQEEARNIDKSEEKPIAPPAQTLEELLENTTSDITTSYIGNEVPKQFRGNYVIVAAESKSSKMQALGEPEKAEVALAQISIGGTNFDLAKVKMGHSKLEETAENNFLAAISDKNMLLIFQRNTNECQKFGGTILVTIYNPEKEEDDFIKFVMR